MLKDLWIIGAGGFGRELLQWVKDINRVQETWHILGFLNDKTDALDGIDCDYAIQGPIQGHVPRENEHFVLAIADPKAKESISKLYKSMGAKFVPIIHPTALISDHVKVGEGLVMYPFSFIDVNVTVGDFVTLLSSDIGHDACVGDYVTISSRCDITGGVVIGKRAFLGSHVTVIPKRRIGDDAHVAAGSVVMTNIKEGAHVFGNPAVRID